MRVLVYGGRDFADKKKLFDKLNEVDDEYGPIHTIIHGDSRGADRLGEEWAEAHNRYWYRYPANWYKFGKQAGPIRNQQMIDEGMIDIAVECPGGNGTADMRGRLEKANILIKKIIDNRSDLDLCPKCNLNPAKSLRLRFFCDGCL